MALCLLVALASCKPANVPALDFAAERERMVRQQVAMRGVNETRLLAAMPTPISRCRSAMTRRFRSPLSSLS